MDGRDVTWDERIEERARAGDREAASMLLEGCREDLVRFCYRYLGNMHEAEDATHDVMALILQGKTWPQRGLRPFLFRMARNRCIDICRRRCGRAFGSFHTDARLLSPRTGPRTAAVREEDRDLVRRHLSALSYVQAEVLMLRYFEGLSRQEIATVLDIPESTVKSRLYDGLKNLHDQMGEKPV